MPNPADPSLPSSAEPSLLPLPAFCEREQCLSGRFLPSDFPRLQESLFNAEGEILYVLQGGTRLSSSGKGRDLVMTCKLEGWLTLTCQVSFEPVRFELHTQRHFVLVPTEAHLPSLTDEAPDEDYIVASQRLEWFSLLEDDLLLALPTVVRSPHLPDFQYNGGFGLN